MAEELKIPTGTRSEKYEALIPQLRALLKGEDDLTACLANTAATLKDAFDFFWVGFYIAKENELVLGPFQGPVACMRIPFGNGVCGKAWEKNQVLIVDDVEKFSNHISCNAQAKSEIVLPANKEGKVALVLDIDSDSQADFDSIDEKYLGQVISMIEKKL
jgi:L-methionine (R)-S-oxide reductase